MSKRAVLWAAVSSRPQAEEASISQQITDGYELAAEKGWNVVAVLVVPGESRDYAHIYEVRNEMGRKLREGEENPYEQLINLIDQRAFDILWVRERSRLGRSDALITGIERACSDIGAIVWSKAMPPTGSEGADLFISAIERASAQYELVEFRRRHRRGMDGRVERGELMATKVPFGYQAERVQVGRRIQRRAVVMPAEAGAYREAVAQILARTATETEITERLRVQFPERSWPSSALPNILRNVFYVGLVQRRRRNDRGGELVQVIRPSGPSLLDHADWPEAQAILLARAERNEWVNKDRRGQHKLHLFAVGVHEPLIGFAQWLALQREMESRSGSRRPYAVKSLWGGMAVCGLCGSTMRYRYSHWQASPDRPVYHYAYYRCGRRDKPHADCDNDIIHGDELTASAVSYLEQLYHNMSGSLDITEEAEAAPDLLAGMEDQRAELLVQRGRLETLAISGRVSLETFDQRAEALDAALADLEGRMAREQGVLASRERVAARLATLGEMLPGLGERLLAADPLAANHWLRKMIERVVVTRGKVTRIDWRD